MAGADAPATRFGRDARLTCRAEYDRVFADALGAGSRYFRVLGRQSDLPAARVGLIVSRKIDRRAVGRNRIKRIVRECFRRQRHRLGSWDLVVLARPGASAATSEELRAALDRCFRRFEAR